MLVVLGVIGSLAMLLWRGSDQRHDKHDRSISDHETRLTKIEEKVHTNEIEIATLRARWHDLTGDVSHALAEWYNNIMDYIRDKK